MFKCSKQHFGKIALFPLMSSALSHKKLAVVTCKSFGSHDVTPLERQWQQKLKGVGGLCFF